jgi:hypothetical protein
MHHINLNVVSAAAAVTAPTEIVMTGFRKIRVARATFTVVAAAAVTSRLLVQIRSKHLFGFFGCLYHQPNFISEGCAQRRRRRREASRV